MDSKRRLSRQYIQRELNVEPARYSKLEFYSDYELMVYWCNGSYSRTKGWRCQEVDEIMKVGPVECGEVEDCGR